MALPLGVMRLDTTGQRGALELRGAFTTMTEDATDVWPRRQVALLVGAPDDGAERYVFEFGLVTRSAIAVATGWHRLSYVRRHEIEPLSVNQIMAAVAARFRRIVEQRAFWGGVLPEKTAEAVTAAIEALRPADGRVLLALRGAETARSVQLGGDALQAAAQEADAVRLAVDIADIPRRELREARPSGEGSFLEALSQLRTPEDTAIAYDSMRFLDFDRLDNPSGVVRFAKGNERLTVLNVNRQPLERTTGADLIYVNETLQSYVLVQYKTMRIEGDDSPRPIYRPDAQLHAELDRMQAIGVGDDDGTIGSFRLHAGYSFLKLCRPVVDLNFSTRELVTGMYLPTDLYDIVTRSDLVKGPRGGVVLGYDTVQRYVSNDLFVLLVRGGWVGSRGVASEQLTDLVLRGLAANRSMTIAATSRAREAS